MKSDLQSSAKYIWKSKNFKQNRSRPLVPTLIYGGETGHYIASLPKFETFPIFKGFHIRYQVLFNFCFYFCFKLALKLCKVPKHYVEDCSPSMIRLA